MSRFDRYLLSQLLALFGFFSLVLVAVYWINRAVGLFDQLIGDGQSALVFLEFSVLTLPNVIRLVLPMSAFVAAVYVTNRLSSESELVVMQATGLSGWQLARPVLHFGLLVALMLLVLSNVLVPASRAALQSRSDEIAQDTSSQFLKDGQFLHPAAGVTFYLREVSPKGELLDLFLTDARLPNATDTYSARRALFLRSETGPKLVMFDGMIQSFDLQSRRLAVTRFGDFTFDLAGLSQPIEARRRNRAELSTWELLFPTPEVLKETRSKIATLQFEAHSRIAHPFLATASALIGFASLLLGAFSRFGMWRQIGVAVLLLVAVQAVATVTTSIGMKIAGGWMLAYVAPVVGLVIAAIEIQISQRERRIPATIPPAMAAAA